MLGSCFIPCSDSYRLERCSLLLIFPTRLTGKKVTGEVLKWVLRSPTHEYIFFFTIPKCPSVFSGILNLLHNAAKLHSISSHFLGFETMSELCLPIFMNFSVFCLPKLYSCYLNHGQLTEF